MSPPLLIPRCIAPVVLDGYTRVQGNFRGELPPPLVRQIFRTLREPTTPEQDERWREHGGRGVAMPMPGGGHAYMTARIGGPRRDVISLYAEDEVYVRIGLESGDVRIDFKARGLWARGWGAVASRWIDAATWWVAGRRCELAGARAESWRVTGVELCSDFVGLDFSDVRQWEFVGFRKRTSYEACEGELRSETMDWGSRKCPISLCVYDKDEQVKAAKGGDDSIYRACHRAHGWSGEHRVRVELRLNGRALKLEHEETGETLDLRDPARLSEQSLLAKVWSVVLGMKRLILRDTATRKKRCELDPRWRAVLDAGDTRGAFGYRQTREVMCDTFDEAKHRARRAMMRGASTMMALVGQTRRPFAVVLQEIATFCWETMADDERAEWNEHRHIYTARREAFIGDEIRTRGIPGFDAWRMAKYGPEDDDGDTS